MSSSTNEMSFSQQQPRHPQRIEKDFCGGSTSCAMVGPTCASTCVSASSTRTRVSASEGWSEDMVFWSSHLALRPTWSVASPVRNFFLRKCIDTTGHAGWH
eukprot:854824-Prymnesium_polylepis.1